ncbi:MAG TPA: monovalent cation/H+ antiporter subunit D family protein [Gammaproteobacteria bacterium]|nr:monovalent cation/H+ antiporter subunit D family protein [Gammaproteobacteria bacterium]
MNALAPHLPALQVVVPLLAAPLVLMLRAPGLAWAAAAATSICAFAISVALTIASLDSGPLSYALGSWAAPYGIELRVDAFSSLVLLIVAGASSVGLLVARPGIDRDIEAERQPTFYAAWLLVLAGLAGIAVAGDAFNIFVFMEISSLATYVVIAGGRGRQALGAVFNYLIMGTIGATFYLIGVGLIYMMTGTLNLADMAERIQAEADLTPVLIAAGCVMVGLAIKAAVFPLHGWLPNAYTFAPHAVTVFIAACSTKVALYALLRFNFTVLPGSLADYGPQFTRFVLPLAVVAMLAASVIAVFQRQVKRMLAYSSIAQIGYMLLGAGMLSMVGLTAGLLHMFNHAIAKGGLFIALACVAARGIGTSLDEMAGAARRMPVTMGAFVVAGLSLIGVPGTAGFISKWHLLLGAFEMGPQGAWLAVPMLLSSVAAVVYLGRVVEAAYFGKAAEPVVRAEAPIWMITVLIGIAAANVYFGINPGALLEIAGEAAGALLPEEAPFELAPSHPTQS